MIKTWNVGLLSTAGNPLLPYLLDRLLEAVELRPVLILDAKAYSDKDMAIFSERTEGAFPVRSLDSFLSRMPHYTVPDHNSEQTLGIIQRHRLELLVNAGTPRKLGSVLLRAVPRGVLNVHPGILPKYRGATCCEWAIYNNDPVGVTAHFMDEGLDSGPILFCETLSLEGLQSYAQVRTALFRLAHAVCAKGVRKIFETHLSPADLPPQPQADVFKPIPGALLEEVKQKLLSGAR